MGARTRIRYALRYYGVDRKPNWRSSTAATSGSTGNGMIGADFQAARQQGTRHRHLLGEWN
jgi:hypothetical protein